VSWSEWISAALLLSGAFFFFAGTVGLLRFPDVYTRLHALTKADNLGLGLTTAGLILQTETLPPVLKLVSIWVLVIVISAAAAYLIAGSARTSGLRPWRRP